MKVLALRTERLKNSQLEWSVLEAVLIDVLNRRKNGMIVFGTARPGQLISASDLIDREEPPDELSAVQLQRTLEAAKDAARAQYERDFVESFRPKDERIVVLDERRLDAEREVRERGEEEIVRAHAPGFSPDKQVAVVRVHLDLGIHTGSVTYVLARQDGKWAVLARIVKSTL